MHLLEKYRRMLHDRGEWGELATFVPNKREPVYNWLYYKEGFSRELVFKLLELFDAKKDQTVLDPFCGSGTVLLASKQLGLRAIGYDVLPITLLASYAKTRNYDIEKLRKAAEILMKERFEKPVIREIPPIVKKAFSKYALDDVLFFKEKISSMEEDMQYFLLIALVRAAMMVSYAWKDGAVIKTRKKHSPPLRFMLQRTISRMLKELEQIKLSQSEIIVEQCDARRMNLPENSVDIIITSPPYLNNIDYTKVYAIENFIVSRARLVAKPAVRSQAQANAYIGLDEEYDYLVTDIEPLQLPQSAKPYFTDMNIVLEQMHRMCRRGAKVAIIVGNGFVEEQIVDVDIMLAYLAEKLGFAVKNVFVLNKRFALTNRTEKKGVLRESLIILEKR
ncbi:MAG: DNA adenine methylase [Candidatus Aenigmarchaeota archaeon]|nr:DNA adenine methylase [Candidatus Aenigmarchaeota archaeon]